MSNLKNPPKPTIHEHPSYAMVGLSRTMNGRGVALFGSALDDHHSTMRLRICRAVREHDLHQDRYFGREQIIEIEMSAAQFVEMITTPNQGDGVPCTLRRLKGAGEIPDVPTEATEVNRVKENFADDLQDMVKVMKERRADIEKLTGKLTAKAQQEIRIALDVIIQQMTSNIPFVLDQFNEASTRVVTAAKHEIEAFTTTVLRSAGMEALAEGRLPKMLLGGKTDPDGK